MSKYNDLMNKVEVSADMKSRILLNLEKELAKEAEEVAAAEEAASEAEEVGLEEVAVAEEVAAVEPKKVVDVAEKRNESNSGNAVGEEKAAVATSVVEQSSSADRSKETEADNVATFDERKRKNRIAAFKRFGALAATFAVLFIGVAAVMSATGGRKMSSSSPSSDSMVMESASEAPAMDAAAEAPMEAEEAAMDSYAEAPMASEDAAMETSDAMTDSAMVSAESAEMEVAATEENAKSSESMAAGVAKDATSEAAETSGGTSTLMSADKEVASMETNGAGSVAKSDADAAQDIVPPEPMDTSPEMLAAPSNQGYIDMTDNKPETAGIAHTVSVIIAAVVLAGILISIIYIAIKSLKK